MSVVSSTRGREPRPLQRADGTPPPPPQSFGQLVALSHDLAHTPSPHLAQAPAVVQPTSTPPGSPKETDPKAMATAAAAINNILRRFILSLLI